MMLRSGTGILLLSLLAGPLASQDAPRATERLPTDATVRVGTLDNGMRFYIRANPRPEQRAELRLAVNAGSILEDEDQLGLAHFTEHMAFNGTANFEKQELVDYLETIGMRFGPDINAYTSFDETVYMLEVPTDDPEMLATAFQILEDWAHRVSFDPEEVDKERGVVIEEWRLGRGAGARMRDQQFPVLFEGSKYADRLPIGTREVLAGAPREALLRFYRDWYRPDLMAVVAVGDFDPDAVEALIRRHMAAVPAHPNPRPRPVEPVPTERPLRFAIATDVEAPNSQVGVVWKHPAASQGTVGDYRRSLVESLYNGMFNARLFELGQQAEPPFAFAGSGTASFIRPLELYQLFAVVEENRITRGLDALLTEAKRVDRFGFTATELERQKSEVLRSYERAHAERDKEESRSYADEYVRAFLDDEPIPGIDYEMELVRALLPTITLDEVNRLGAGWIRPEGRVVLVNAPEKPGLATPGEDELQGVFSEVEGRAVEPYEDAASDAPLVAVEPTPSPVVEENRIDEIGVTVWKLGNGVRVILKPTDFKDDEIRFGAWSPGGTSLASDDDFVSASMAASIVGRSGLGDFDFVTLQKKLTGKAIQVFPLISTLSEGFTGFASPKDQETLFQVLYLQFTAPRKDDTAYLALRAQVQGFLANREADPQAAFQDTVTVTMAQHHPRARPLSVSLFDEVDPDRAFEFYRDRFSDAGDFTFFFVGSFTPDGIRPLVERYLGGLPATGRTESWRDPGIDPPTGMIRKEVRKGLEPQSRTQIIFAGPGTWSPEESTILSTLADVLDIRLREVLREDLGGTYGVGVSGAVSRIPDEEYSFRISFGSAPERVEELTEAVLAEIRRIQAEGPSPDVVAKVRETQRRTKETNLRENQYWLGQLQSYDQNDLDPREIPSFARIEQWTPRQVQEAANLYLTLDRYVKVSLVPETRVP